MTAPTPQMMGRPIPIGWLVQVWRTDNVAQLFGTSGGNIYRSQKSAERQAALLQEELDAKLAARQDDDWGPGDYVVTAFPVYSGRKRA